MGYRFKDRFNDESRNLESLMKFVSEWGEEILLEGILKVIQVKRFCNIFYEPRVLWEVFQRGTGRISTSSLQGVKY